VTTDLIRRVELIASDRESGASEILDAALEVLREALRSGEPMQPIVRALVTAQPAMASLWSAGGAALGAEGEPGRFERFVQQVARAPRILSRFAVELLTTGVPATAPLRIVTLSFSRSVAVALEAVHAQRTLRVSCAESRPALEGRRLAARLSAAGITVTCYTDAGIGQALASADAVVLGADAVAPEWFLNKSGSRMLAAAAAQQGVPVYVVATRDKFVPHAVAARLEVREGPPAEIWPSPPAGVTVRNAYFEPTPIDVVTAVISDLGVLGAGLVPDACNAQPDLLGLDF
jgi:translation initiation factor 2B subunit (eIF-2B alpha/beta/delta family)